MRGLCDRLAVSVLRVLHQLGQLYYTWILEVLLFLVVVHYGHIWKGGRFCF
jgi:hypothetical protein